MTQRIPWFRMYTDFLNDPKLIALAFEDQRHFIGVLALKSDGALEAYVDEQLMDRIVAQRLWIDHGVIREVKRRLVAAGLIDSAWQPLAWDRRQFKSDSSKDRVAAYRANKKAGNGDVTLQQRKSSAVDTDTDTDKEEEKKGEKSADAPSLFVLPDWINKKHWDAWHSCAKRKKATDAQKQMAVEKLDAWRQAGIDFAGALENAAIGGWQGLFKPDDKKPAISQPTESFAERDARTKREAWEAMTNRKWPEQDLPSTARGLVIDAEPNTHRRIA